MTSSPSMNSFSLNSTLHGVAIARNWLLNSRELPKFCLRTTHKLPLLRLTLPSIRLLPRGFPSKDSQPSSGSRTELSLNTLEEEPRTLLSNGSSRSPDHHPLKSPAMPLRIRSLMRATNSSLPTSVQRTTLCILKLMSNMLTLRTRSPSYMLILHAKRTTVSAETPRLFSSDNSRKRWLPIPETQIRMPSRLSSSHLWSQPFSNSPRTRSKPFLETNKTLSFSSEIQKTRMLHS